MSHSRGRACSPAARFRRRGRSGALCRTAGQRVRPVPPRAGHGQLAGRLPVTLALACAVLPLCYRNVMAVRKKRSISMPPELDAEIAAAAAQSGMSYSAWLADTARKEFTIRAGLAAVSQFERDHGAFTSGELAEAEEWAVAAVERARRTGTSSRRRTA